MPEQQAEPALMVGGLFTTPAPQHRRLGQLLAWWAVDYAARHISAVWVRGHTSSERVMRYARDTIGCTVETVLREKRHVHLLQHPSLCMPSLQTLIADQD
ncbi:hypothetical protein [Streptomyces roseifaciens]|uniref:hypothetical protein n=1 Tax=Streptomyces roseifaciens TaxID=1488406 RepID=UPI00071810DD|nr:hypothetical protein [Streptomyces roseifaciens]